MPSSFGGGYFSPLPVFTQQLRRTLPLIAPVNKHILVSSGMESVLLLFNDTANSPSHQGKEGQIVGPGCLPDISFGDIRAECHRGDRNQGSLEDEEQGDMPRGRSRGYCLEDSISRTPGLPDWETKRTTTGRGW
jgi:hypothetical protein